MCAIGSAVVRNVTLPATYSHIGLPDTLHLAVDARTRAWIDAYVPDGAQAPAAGRCGYHEHRARRRLWFSVKQHWCLAAQRLIRCPARRDPAMKGRLNLFQASMLRWRELHPYNAVHVVRIARPLVAADLQHAIDERADPLGPDRARARPRQAAVRIRGRRRA